MLSLSSLCYGFKRVAFMYYRGNVISQVKKLFRCFQPAWDANKLSECYFHTRIRWTGLSFVSTFNCNGKTCFTNEWILST